MSENVTCLERPGQTLPVMLIVGDMGNWQRAGRQLPVLAGFHFVGFADVTPATIDRIRPDVVLSALFSAEFDAIDLARRLAGMQFDGRYRALAMSLPDPDVIRSEIAAVAAGLDFDLFLIDATGLRPPRR